MMNYSIIPATTTDAERLSEIAWQAKSHWKYPRKWMELWRTGLTITSTMIAKNAVYKLVLESGEIVACTVLITEKDILWVEHLWVLPDYIGNGFGRQLLTSALDKTIQSHHKSIKVISDENAEMFYQKMGFATIGQYESVPKGRFLPIMTRSIKII